MTLTDQSTRTRAGEELDASLIDPYLKAHIPGLSGLPRISQFPGGVCPASPALWAIRKAIAQLTEDAEFAAHVMGGLGCVTAGRA
eukprot:gene47080-58743_t